MVTVILENSLKKGHYVAFFRLLRLQGDKQGLGLKQGFNIHGPLKIKFNEDENNISKILLHLYLFRMEEKCCNIVHVQSTVLPPPKSFFLIF